MDGNAEGFKIDYFSQLAELESANFWFRIRNDLILAMVRRHFADAHDVLEVGCGTGFVLSALAGELTNANISGSEIYSRGLEYASRRVPRANLMQMDARSIPFRNEFDLVGAFDVLEHINEDSAVLDEIAQALKPNGGLLITVPQHMFLWSHQDVAACHVRRYVRGELEKKMERAGFRILRSTSFVTLLMPLLIASRLGRKNADENFDPAREFRIPGVVNRALYAALRFEYGLIAAGLDFPFGGTRLIAAIKDPR